MTTNTSFTTLAILGVDVVASRSSAVLDDVVARIEWRRPHALAFANANLLNQAYADAGLREMLGRCVVLNDGAGVNLAARVLYGQGFPENLNGTDLTTALMQRLPAGRRVFLLGARPEVVARAVQVFHQCWPHLVLAGARDGYFASSEQAAALAEVVSTAPDVVLVAMGNGRQERVALALMNLGVPSSWAVGALFDFWAGIYPRAPMWMRALGLEWVYRLLQEPGRLWRRYVLGNPLFVMRVLQARVRYKIKNI